MDWPSVDCSATRLFRGRPIGDRQQAQVTGLRLVAEQRAHAKIELTDPNEADAFSILDRTGKALTLHVYQGKPKSIGTRGRIDSGFSDVTSVSTAGITLVLFSGPRTVRSVPIRLEAGSVRVIRP